MRRAFYAVLLASLGLACGDAELREETSAEKPRDQVRLWLNNEPVPLLSGAKLSELVDLTLFADFRPGLTAEEATKRFGNPVQVARDYRGTFYHYNRQGRSVAVAHLAASSGGAKWEDWSIYAYPADPTASTLFRAAILTAIAGRTGEVVLSVVSGGSDARISASLTNGRVGDVRWYSVRP